MGWSGNGKQKVFHFWPKSLESVSEKQMSLVTRKPVFGVCDKVKLKLACSATETS